MLGVLYISAGQYDVAVGWISQAIRLNNQNPHFLANLAGALRKLGKLNEALEILPSRDRAKAGFGRRLFRGGADTSRPAASETRQSTASTRFLHSNQTTSTLTAAWSSPCMNPTGPTMHLQPAIVDWLDCRTRLTFTTIAALSFNPSVDFDEALLAYDRAIETSSSRDFLPFNNRVAILRKTRRFNEALQTCDRGLSLYPDSADLLNCKGVVLTDLDRISITRSTATTKPLSISRISRQLLATRPKWR